MTALSEALNNAKGDRSVDQLIDDAARRGIDINPTARATIYKALNGQHAKSPREGTLKLFADVFKLDIRDLREAAAKPRGELEPWTPVPEAARLNQEQREALNQLIRSIVQRADITAQTGDPWTEPGASDLSEPSRLFTRWDSLFHAMRQVELEYAQTRGLDQHEAAVELLETTRMFQQGLEGRPWTPPWMSQDADFIAAYGEGATPWLRSWWAGGDGKADSYKPGGSAPTSLDPDDAEALRSGAGVTAYQAELARRAEEGDDSPSTDREPDVGGQSA